ncbi:MAG: hypothetical protein HY744_07850 [Deltaproteobacteria bacterium]|nr:hypothetical protein [Deltaproteobacteria bacterium]
MSAKRTFRIAGYLPSSGGGFAAKLEPAAAHPSASVRETGSTTLWSGIHDEAQEGLVRALSHPANAELLGLLCGRAQARPLWCARELGGSGELDLCAALTDPESGERLLLLVQSEPAGATKQSSLRVQYVQALRVARAVLGNLCFPGPSPEPVLVLMAGWRPWLRPPLALHMPAWEGNAVPRPCWWGYLPFTTAGAEHVLLGRWEALDADGWARQVEERGREWMRTELRAMHVASRPLRTIEYGVDLGPESTLVFLLDRGPFRARLRVTAPKHRRALLPPEREDHFVRRIRTLRHAAYEGKWAPTGWKFLGETIEKGCPWLNWLWVKPAVAARVDWVTAEAEAETFAITMKMYLAGC